ncbi:MAG: aminotransferase class I/II-fold pyridoxal phosphate-dependent enzyme [Candidatus Coatesbacteria bacterium]|nr:aminotransferase class I/II-fold pyridoxal phosphate-dependent enzyme [Candidatus Coatesbacteria bacterium]
MMNELEPIDFSPPALDEREIAAVSAVLRSGWLTHGPRTREFEQRFAELVGAEYAVAVASGTAALHLALECAGIGPGDEVITSPLTFVSAGEVILQRGARPVFADVDPATGNLTPKSARAALSGKTRAVMPVHLGGYPVEMDGFIKLCAECDLALIDDAAHAVEARSGGRPLGALGDAGCYSFYVTKNLTTGEGGMLVTSRKEWAQRARLLRLHGMDRDAWNRYAADGRPGYDITALGYKYNLTDIAAALGLVQLDKLAENRRRRLELAAAYDEELADLPGIETPARPAADSDDEHAWHLYTVRVLEDRCTLSRDELAARLHELRTATALHFHPLHLMSFYRERLGTRPGLFPIAERLGRERLSLPFSPAYGPATAAEVARRIRLALQQR